MPGYQFGLDQGQRGIQASAAARGGLLTGAAVKASDKFATDYATSKYNDLVNQKLAAYTTNTANVDRPFNQAATLASLGQNATSGVVNAANNYASNVRNAGSAYGANATDLITGGANANAGQLLSAGASNTNTYQTLANIVGQALANYRQTGSL